MFTPGSFVKEDDEIIEYTSEKGTTVQRIPVSGKIIKFLVNVD